MLSTDKIPQSTFDEIFFQFFKAAEIESRR